MISDTPSRSITRIISGGQTGVDRGSLDAGLNAGLPVGGWCPAGRMAEDGRIPGRYPLRETTSEEYADRTRKNIEEGDATLILHRGEISGGTLLTLQYARQIGKPHLVIDLDDDAGPASAAAWLRRECPAVLNVAGPRESGAPGIGVEAERWLTDLLSRIKMREG